LNNTGQTGGRADADIDAPEAWDITTGSSSVLIAVIDTGVDYNHPDLRGGRVRTDIDRDFVNNDEDAMDDHGHGTFVAGIAAASANNELGIAGVCPGCQMLPIKVLTKDGKGSADGVARGIQYAAQAGARIISMSLGVPSKCGCSQTIARAINYAFERGSLLIAASGNDGDKQRISYPASSPRVMSVGASDHNDQEASFSNRNSYLDIVAPGKDIYSLKSGGGYVTESGTSAATPFVSGAAGLIWSVNPQLSNVQVWWRLYHSADDFPAQRSAQTIETAPTPEITVDPARVVFRVYLPAMSRSRVTFGRLNARQALEISGSGQMLHRSIRAAASLRIVLRAAAQKWRLPAQQRDCTTWRRCAASATSNWLPVRQDSAGLRSMTIIVWNLRRYWRVIRNFARRHGRRSISGCPSFAHWWSRVLRLLRLFNLSTSVQRVC
jgi:Subtilisin-like serine proteases